ncbi:MAG: alkanesulfonate monooxygenase SsuD, partial [Halovenus sp.]
RAYIDDLEHRLDTHDRAADSVAFFPGLVPIVGETEAIARAKYESYRDAIDVEGVLALLSGFVDMDLSELEPDKRLEHIETEAIQGVVNAFTTNDDRDWTVREMAEFAGLGTTSPVVVGTPEDVADTFEHWHRDLDVDGINVKEVVRPDTLVDFVDLVVPELRDRGVLADPDGETLRERTSGQRGLPESHPGRAG